MSNVRIYDLDEGCSIVCHFDDGFEAVKLDIEGLDGQKAIVLLDKHLFKRFCLVASRLNRSAKAKASTSSGFIAAYDEKDDNG